MTEPTAAAPAPLFGASDIRRLAEEIGIRPTKTLGQNFVIDGNTIRRIVSVANIGPTETVLEVGPALVPSRWACWMPRRRWSPSKSIRSWQQSCRKP
ncbi:ribosomal RNA small subunit methyltransferase A [Arthrobacter sp. Hiyo4]|nr:ribosomal RNA small subunit methyltransferase A [Arthrobacter sp. Hiyo4]